MLPGANEADPNLRIGLAFLALRLKIGNRTAAFKKSDDSISNNDELQKRDNHPKME